MQVMAKDEDFCYKTGARSEGDDDAEAVRAQNESMWRHTQVRRRKKQIIFHSRARDEVPEGKQRSWLMGQRCSIGLRESCLVILLVLTRRNQCSGFSFASQLASWLNI